MPTIYNVGAIASGTGAVTPGLPLGTLADDILLLLIENQDASGIGTVTGYTVITNAFVSSGTLTRLTALYKRATSSESAPSIPDPGDHAVARIIGIRGCINTGSPVNASAPNTQLVSDTSVSIPGVTTTAANCMIVAAFTTGTDVASTTHVSGFANASLANVTERVDNWVIAGGGGGIGACTGEKATAGATGATTATIVTANFKALITIALQGATSGGTVIKRRSVRGLVIR